MAFNKWQKVISITVVAITILSGIAIALNGIQSSGKEIKWSLTPAGELLRPPLFNENGSMYIPSYDPINHENKLFFISSQGKVYWMKEMYNIESAAVGPNGTLYCGGLLNSTDRFPSLWAIGSNGSMDWVSPFRNGSFYSIQIGPDGDIYTLFSTLYSEPQVGGTRIAKFNQEGALLWYLSPGNDTSFTNLAFMANGTLMSWDGHFNWISTYGSIIWRSNASTSLDVNLVINDTLYGTVNYYLDSRGLSGLYCYNLHGSILWKYGPGTDNMSFGDQVIQDAKGMLYFEGSTQVGAEWPRTLFAVDQNGTFHWKYKQETMSFPALYESQVVVVNNQGIKALDDNGKIAWTFAGAIGSAVYSSNGQLYVINQVTNTITGVGDSTSILAMDGALIGMVLISIGLVALLAIWIVNKRPKGKK